MLVIELPLDVANKAVCAEPDLESSLVYDHLEHYCAKFAAQSPLPAITVTDKDGVLGIIRGHKYLQVANKLGLKSIRAIVFNTTNTGVVCELLHTGNARQVDSNQIVSELNQTQIIEGWHVFYFDSELLMPQRMEFENRVVEFFRIVSSPLLIGRVRTITGLEFLMDGLSCEFQATTPVGDASWFPSFHSVCISFHRQIARIASYQGRRFAD